MNELIQRFSLFRPFFRDRFFFFAMVLFMLVSGACSDSDAGGTSQYDENKPIVVTTFRPLEGGIREKVLLDGENFGSDPSKIKVFFNQKEAPVISSNGNRIYTMVPRLPGDVCTVTVQVGEQKATYDQTFAYHSKAYVSTITGNGSKIFKAGTLAEAQVYARYIAVDAEGNIFASHRDEGTNAVVRINELENIVTPLILGNASDRILVPNAPAVDLETGVITVPDDGTRELYFTFDPKEGWAPRQHSISNSSGIFGQIDNSGQKYKYAMTYCPYDGFVYTRYRDGNIVKFNTQTNEAYIVYKTNLGPCYGMAFDPTHPNLLYMSFHTSVTEYGNNLCLLDVSDPSAADAFKVISSGLSGAGHKDGPVKTAQFNDPRQICFDQDGNLFIADYGNHCIRRLSPDGIVETVVGQPGVSGWADGDKVDALFLNPWGLAVAPDGTVYISDYGNARIRKLTIE